MYEITADYCQGAQFRAHARGHELITDQPVNNGGSDRGMTPPELFLASLGSCAAFYAVAYLKKKGLLREGVEVRASAEKVPAPARLDSIHIDVEIPGGLSDADRAGVEDAVHRCVIHNTILHTPSVAIAIRTLAAV